MPIDDSELDRLYQLPPSEFIAVRNALAKRAGAQGAEIRALPKPTLAVWAVNQLHWRHPDIHRPLVESAGNLRATHKAVIGGGRGCLRAAGRAHEAGPERALKAPLAIAAAGGPPATPPAGCARRSRRGASRSSQACPRAGGPSARRPAAGQSRQNPAAPRKKAKRRNPLGRSTERRLRAQTELSRPRNAPAPRPST